MFSRLIRPVSRVSLRKFSTESLVVVNIYFFIF